MTFFVCLGINQISVSSVANSFRRIDARHIIRRIDPRQISVSCKNIVFKKGKYMAITTTSTLPSPVQQTFNMKLLAVRVPTLIHDICAKFYRMPRNGGTTMRFRRYENLDTFPTPLGNSGENPPAQSPTAVDIDAKLSLYATYVVLNEQVVLQNNDPKKCGVFKFSLIDLESYGAIALW